MDPQIQGTRLAVNPLAAELGVSPTPVREALAWLGGEGRFVRDREGYGARRLDRVALADLYTLAAVLTVPALARNASRPANAEEEPFASLTARLGNRALAAALARVHDQLAPFARAENQVLGAEEGAALAAALLAGEGNGRLAARVRRFYRRRARHAGEILGTALGLS